MTLTTTQIAVYFGAFLCVLIAVLDTWVFSHAFTATVDLLLLGTGLGAFLGQSIPLVGTAVAATRRAPTA